MVLLFQLPCERYTAFRFIATEIIEDISYTLEYKSEDGTYLVAETNQFIQFITPGLENKRTKDISSRCFMKLAKHTKQYLYHHTSEIIN